MFKEGLPALAREVISIDEESGLRLNVKRMGL